MQHYTGVGVAFGAIHRSVAAYHTLQLYEAAPIKDEGVVEVVVYAVCVAIVIDVLGCERDGGDAANVAAPARQAIAGLAVVVDAYLRLHAANARRAVDGDGVGGAAHRGHREGSPGRAHLWRARGMDGRCCHARKQTEGRQQTIFKVSHVSCLIFLFLDDLPVGGLPPDVNMQDVHALGAVAQIDVGVAVFHLAVGHLHARGVEGGHRTLASATS